jgi:hypothetical protein
LYHIRHTTPILKITKLDKRKALDLQGLTKVIYLGCGTRGTRLLDSLFDTTSHFFQSLEKSFCGDNVRKVDHKFYKEFWYTGGCPSNVYTLPINLVTKLFA